jgi:hypothetical protein
MLIVWFLTGYKVVLRVSGGSSEAQARLVQVDVLAMQSDALDDL